MDIEPGPAARAGDYPMAISILSQAGQELATAEITPNLLNASCRSRRSSIPAGTHVDSLAATYHQPMFSIEHIRVLRSFIHLAANGA